MSFHSSLPTSRREFLGAAAVAVSSAMCSNASHALAAEEANNSSALYYRSARSLRDMIRAKTVSSAEVITSFIERIDLVDPQINAVTYFPRRKR